MKLIRKAKRIDVKRTFVLTRFLRKHGVARKNHTKIPELESYLNAHKKAINEVKKLKENEIDKLILEKFRHINVKKFIKTREKRLNSYDTAKWFVAIADSKELGVWKKAGGLPLIWTKGSVAETAKLVADGIKNNDKKIQKRSRIAIPAIIALKKAIQKDAYSFPIVFESGQGTNGRKGLPKTKFDLDDGNMRAIAYAASGDKKIKVYVGILPK